MHAIRITLKDLRLLTRDRRALIILLALPLVLISLIGASAGKLVTRYSTDETTATRSPASEVAQSGDGVDSASRVYRSIVPGYTVLFVFFLLQYHGPVIHSGP